MNRTGRKGQTLLLGRNDKRIKKAVSFTTYEGKSKKMALALAKLNIKKGQTLLLGRGNKRTKKAVSFTTYEGKSEKMALALAKLHGAKIHDSTKSVDLKVKFADGSVWVIEVKKSSGREVVASKVPKGAKFTARANVTGKARVKTVVAKVTGKGIEYKAFGTAERIVPPRDRKE
jgi:hypothetical protein